MRQLQSIVVPALWWFWWYIQYSIQSIQNHHRAGTPIGCSCLICNRIADNDEVVAVEDLIDEGNILDKSWVTLSIDCSCLMCSGIAENDEVAAVESWAGLYLVHKATSGNSIDKFSLLVL